MVKIRLRRTGQKKAASYRVVVAHSTSPRNGRFIENIGHYQPREDPPSLVIKEDRLFYWLSQGAQPSDSANRIFQSKGLLDRFQQFKAGELTVEEPSPAETAPEETAVEA